MPCGCMCPKCQRERLIGGTAEAIFAEPRDARDTPPPLADWFTSPRMTLPREGPMPRPIETIAAYEQPIPHSEWIGPSDRMGPVLTIREAYDRQLLRVRQTVPRPEWQRATGYSTIASRQVEALDAPRYSFAAMDTTDLVDEVYGER